MAHVLRSFAEFQHALRQEFAAFQVEKDGALYDIGIGEGGELVCAWRASDPEAARAVKRLGNTSPWTGLPDPDVAYRLAEWLGVEVPQNGATDSLAGAPVLAVDPSRSTPNTDADASTPPVSGVSHV